MDTDSAFRHVNDSIRELAPAGAETETFEFLCECADIRCHAFVRLTLREFDARRAASPPAPILAAHEDGQASSSGRARAGIERPRFRVKPHRRLKA